MDTVRASGPGVLRAGCNDDYDTATPTVAALLPCRRYARVRTAAAQARAVTHQAEATTSTGPAGSSPAQRERSAARPGSSSPATYAPGRPDPEGERLPPVGDGPERAGDGQRRRLHVREPGRRAQLLEVSLPRPGEAGLVGRLRVEVAHGPPEQAQRAAAARVVPHARGHDPARARHASHLHEPGDRVGHEVHDELGQRGVERVVVVGQPLGGGGPHVDRGEAGAGRGDEGQRRVHGRDGSRPEPLHQLRGQGTRPAADVEHPLTRSHAGRVGEQRRQRLGSTRP